MVYNPCSGQITPKGKQMLKIIDENVETIDDYFKFHFQNIMNNYYQRRMNEIVREQQRNQNDNENTYNRNNRCDKNSNNNENTYNRNNRDDRNSNDNENTYNRNNRDDRNNRQRSSTSRSRSRGPSN